MAKKKQKLDAYLIHEALDRTNMVAEIIGTHLSEHPGVKGVPKAAKKIKAAGELLDAAYEILGAAAVYESSLPIFVARKEQK